MDIGFGAPIAGAWATPRNLTEFGRRGNDSATGRCGRSSGC